MKNHKLILWIFLFSLFFAFGGPAYSSVSFAGGSEYMNVDSADTGIVQPAVFILEINSGNDLTSLRKEKVNIVLAKINEQLKIVSDSETICSVDEFRQELRNSTIIGFEVFDETTLDVLINYLNINDIKDVFIVAKDNELLYKARKKFSLARGVLDLRGRENLTSSETVRLANQGFSKIVILDAEILTLNYVEFIQKRYISVWVSDENSSKKDAVCSILKGVNGVLTHSIRTYSQVYSEIFDKENSLVRKSFVIGHRGSGSTEGGFSIFGPENTLESAQRAYFDGADFVEIDVHLTLDKEIVVMHDSAVGTLMNAMGTIETTNYADLKNYTYKNFDDSYHIATLKEYIEYFQKTDCMLVIELKDYGEELAKSVAEMIYKYEFQNRCVVICFSRQALRYLFSNYPEISCGGLSSNDYRVYEKVYDEKHGVYKNGKLVLNDTLYGFYNDYGGYNCSYNPSYTVLTAEVINQLQKRGSVVNLWTLQNISQIDQYRLQGVASMTIDGISVLAETIREIYTEKEEYSVYINEEVDVKVFGKVYARCDSKGNIIEDIDLTGDSHIMPILVEGDAFEITKDNRLKAVKEGETTLIFRSKLFSSAGEYFIYSQPVTLVAEQKTVQGCESGFYAGDASNVVFVMMFSIILFSVILDYKKKRL